MLMLQAIMRYLTAGITYYDCFITSFIQHMTKEPCSKLAKNQKKNQQQTTTKPLFL